MRVAERVASPALYDLPQEFSEEIGRIVVRWAYLEHYVQRIVWMLLELDPKRGRLAVRDPSMQERIVMISDLASLQAIKLELSAFLNNAKVTAGERNLVAHGLWMKDADGSWYVQDTKGEHPKDVKGLLSHKRRIEPGSVKLDIERLRSITSAIDGLIGSARSLQAEAEKQMPGRAGVRFPFEASASNAR